MEEIRIFEGGVAVDDRGSVAFANDFDFRGIRRFYVVENFSTDVVRAFHGHLVEGKYVFVVRGSIILALVPLDDPRDPSRDAPVTRIVLSDRRPRVVYAPPGYANGFRALEPGTRIIFFSTATLAESAGDDIRLPADYWGEAVWRVENR